MLRPCWSDTYYREDSEADDRHYTIRPESHCVQDGVGRNAVCGGKRR